MTPRINTKALTRRQAVGVAGAGGAAALLARFPGADRLLGSTGIVEEAQAQATSCVLIPAKTVGGTSPTSGSTAPTSAAIRAPAPSARGFR